MPVQYNAAVVYDSTGLYNEGAQAVEYNDPAVTYDNVGLYNQGAQTVAGGGAARPKMRYERVARRTIEDELEEITLALLLLL